MGVPSYSYDRGMKLTGKPIGLTLLEVLGPVDGRNYFDTTNPPLVHIQVFGTGEVQVEENPTFAIQGENSNAIGSTPPIHTKRVPDPTTWAALGAVIDASSGLVTRILTPIPTFNYFRIVITGVGTGRVSVVTDWN